MFDILPWKGKNQRRGNILRNEIDSIYDRLFQPNFLAASPFSGAGIWAPDIDISESRRNIAVKAEIPGMDAGDFDICIDGRLLCIKGEKKQERKEKGETYFRVESSYGFFSRTIELPAEVESSKVDASYKRGILKIKLRKAKENETRRIKVTSG